MPLWKQIFNDNDQSSMTPYGTTKSKELTELTKLFHILKKQKQKTQIYIFFHNTHTLSRMHVHDTGTYWWISARKT